jgi:GMP synthase-like glutamine amidotransferase
MKPIVICRYAPHEGPGYFATYLTRRRIPWQLVKLDRGEALPQATQIAGLAMMGGPMSVNDELQWISPMLELVRASVAENVPVIGHCLGGQLLAKALGAAVAKNPVKEIGWGRVSVLSASAASDWSGEEAFLSYHWHGETFAIPKCATRIWSSEHCENQAFVTGGIHIGMQCHIEITADLIASWCDTGDDEIRSNLSRSPAVQTPAQMREKLDQRLEALHAVADRVYERWIKGLRN